jgi:hypothetical protein
MHMEKKLQGPYFLAEQLDAFHVEPKHRWAQGTGHQCLWFPCAHQCLHSHGRHPTTQPENNSYFYTQQCLTSKRTKITQLLLKMAHNNIYQEQEQTNKPKRLVILLSLSLSPKCYANYCQNQNYCHPNQTQRP